MREHRDRKGLFKLPNDIEVGIVGFHGAISPMIRCVNNARPFQHKKDKVFCVPAVLRRQNSTDGACFTDKLPPNLSAWRASNAFGTLKTGLERETDAKAGRQDGSK
jgi:hypothetical protein